MKTIIAGGRDYQFTQDDAIALCDLDISLVIAGGQRGADKCAIEWAKRRGIPYQEFPVTNAEWRRLGLAAGPIRNGMMAAVAEALVAFPGGDGTADMVRQAKRKRLVIYDWRESIAALNEENASLD